MKFREDQDKIIFLVECDQPVPSSLDLTSWEPTEEMKSLFIKKRAEIIPRMKSFRRSQATKAQWRRDRYKLMQGIGDFHRSTAGKRFHRSMGRFLALRDFGDMSLFRRDTRDDDEALMLKPVHLSSEDRGSFLKALSSIRTHLFIESEYYMPLSQQVAFDFLLEEVVDAFSRLERSIIYFEEMNSDDIDLLVRMVNQEDLIASLVAESSRVKEEVEDAWRRADDIVWREFGRAKEDNASAALSLSLTKKMIGL